MLKFLQTCLQPLECGFAVGMLRSAFCSCHGNTGGAMHQPHARFDFIAMLPAWPTSFYELEIAIAFKRFSVGWIHWCQIQLFLVKRTIEMQKGASLFYRI